MYNKYNTKYFTIDDQNDRFLEEETDPLTDYMAY